ncbi:MAG: sensor histidine kinase [Halobacteriales archaeon]
MGDRRIDNDDILDLIEAETPAAIHQATVTVAKDILEADTVHLVRNGGGDLEGLASAVEPGVDDDLVPLAADVVDRLDLIGRSHVFEDIRDVRSVSTTAAESRPSYAPRSLLLVPVEGVGHLVATSGSTDAFDDADRRWAERLGDLVSGILAADIDGRSDPSTARMERIATILSHDFADPLTVARGAIELAEETGAPEHFDRVRRAIDRIEHLVTGVERMARADDRVARLEVVELAAILEEVWPTIDHDDATLDVVDTRQVVADRYAFEQLLVNLLSNAVEHGGDHVRVGVTDDGFYVEDDGPGIPSGLREDIFAWGSSSTRGHKGIGLSIVSQIVDAHDWSIEVGDGELGGARFEVHVDSDGEA